MAATVFISYRRSDAPTAAELIYQRLVKALSKPRVFFDVDSIGAGDDWPSELEKYLDRSTALVVVIGQGWLDAKGANGALRLHQADDRVVQEIRGAIERGMTIISVLVEGATFPSAASLPREIRALARKHFLEVRAGSITADLDRLVGEIKGRSWGRTVLVATLVAVAAATVLAFNPNMVTTLRASLAPPVAPPVDGALATAPSARVATPTQSAETTTQTRAHQREEQDWENAKKIRSVGTIELFLREHRNGRFADAARTEIADIRDDEAFATAERVGTSAAFEAYLKAAPTGQHRFVASQRVAALETKARAAIFEQQFDVLARTGKRADLLKFAETNPDYLNRVEEKLSARGALKVAVGPVTAPSHKWIFPGEGKDAEDQFKDCEFCPEMVVVDKGTFKMGDSDVTIAKPFAVGRFEVTVREIIAWKNSLGWNLPDLSALEKIDWKTTTLKQATAAFEQAQQPLPGFLGEQGSAEFWNKMLSKNKPANISLEEWQKAQDVWIAIFAHQWERIHGQNDPNSELPAIVFWEDANSYVNWVATTSGRRYRLLTDDEWGWAARGGKTSSYFFDGEPRCYYSNKPSLKDDPQDCPVVKKTANLTTVGSFRPNSYGLYDVIGNLAEHVRKTNKYGMDVSGGANGGDYDDRSTSWFSFSGSDLLGLRIARDLD